MKFKAQDMQNQLIENITVHYLVVGVDIAQEVHMARAVSFRGIALGTPLEFGNHSEGFQIFERWIQDLPNTYKLSSIMVGMVPTGHAYMIFLLSDCLIPFLVRAA
ncbi:hypothetical protein [Paenibacillus spongiae]|uniref:IS110 family transposase n=1 Tax=Paenibacillus spongiae TaxID=2909671 RepID=A0ABY5S9P7_9BACL|nr:hypothetical protein [Paenibacillus spongiae]UVI29265.1 hypothetical protein L1F29_28165 [Paenibacillus spongiae]